jgi:hypothetical protein
MLYGGKNNMGRYQLLSILAGICFWLTPHTAVAQEPTGRMEAEPNPCIIHQGQDMCETFIRWQTRGVQAAKVFVVAEGRHEAKEAEFRASTRCEGHDCRANWIRPDTKYKFELFDFTRGDRGRKLAEVVVYGERRD